ncbi:MAG: hydrogenase maturation nickel metallochaperone HypA [Egibacteraceae bacterium]
MHEIGMCESVLAAVERRADGRPVAGLTVRVGTLLRVQPEAFAQSFELVAAGSVADGAHPELVFVPVQGTCDDCGATFDSRDPTPACPTCGSVRVTREGGDDLVLESIRYHAAEPAERS